MLAVLSICTRCESVRDPVRHICVNLLKKPTEVVAGTWLDPTDIDNCYEGPRGKYKDNKASPSLQETIL